jgi:hypothetical protein
MPHCLTVSFAVMRDVVFINGNVFMGDWTIPTIVVALPVTNKIAVVFL